LLVSYYRTMFLKAATTQNKKFSIGTRKGGYVSSWRWPLKNPSFRILGEPIAIRVSYYRTVFLKPGTTHEQTFETGRTLRTMGLYLNERAVYFSYFNLKIKFDTESKGERRKFCSKLRVFLLASDMNVLERMLHREHSQSAHLTNVIPLHPSLEQ